MVCTQVQGTVTHDVRKSSQGGAGTLCWKRGCGSMQRLMSQPEGEGDTENEASLALCPAVTIIQLPKALSEAWGPARPKWSVADCVLCDVTCITLQALGFCQQNEVFKAEPFPRKGVQCRGFVSVYESSGGSGHLSLSRGFAVSLWDVPLDQLLATSGRTTGHQKDAAMTRGPESWEIPGGRPGPSGCMLVTLLPPA